MAKDRMVANATDIELLHFSGSRRRPFLMLTASRKGTSGAVSAEGEAGADGDDADDDVEGEMRERNSAA
jgi:hypothetical protein